VLTWDTVINLNPGMERSMVSILTRLMPPVAAALILLAGGPASAPAASPAADKPADPGFVYQRAVFDCTPRATWILEPGFTLTLADSTFGTGAVDGYACRDWSETGPEAFYELVVPAAAVGEGFLEVFVGLRDLDDRDLDLFLLETCDTDSCLVGANIEFTTLLGPGTYTLVVDGYRNSPEPFAGNFTLVLESRLAGLPPEICEPGGADAVYCQVETATFEGDLAQEDNHLQDLDCNSSLQRSGDQWYAVTVAAYHEFTATLTAVGSGLDPSLWLLGSCHPENECLAFVDAKVQGQGETLKWSNPSFLDTVVYLGVDAFLPPGEGEDEGVFTLEVRCQAMVPAEKTPLGSVRSLFR